MPSYASPFSMATEVAPEPTSPKDPPTSPPVVKGFVQSTCGVVGASLKSLAIHELPDMVYHSLCWAFMGRVQYSLGRGEPGYMVMGSSCTTRVNISLLLANMVVFAGTP